MVLSASLEIVLFNCICLQCLVFVSLHQVRVDKHLNCYAFVCFLFVFGTSIISLRFWSVVIILIFLLRQIRDLRKNLKNASASVGDGVARSFLKTLVYLFGSYKEGLTVTKVSFDVHMCMLGFYILVYVFVCMAICLYY